jgi:hypothetical protein
MILVFWLSALAAAPPAQPRTPEAVIAADDAWGNAESQGNSEFLEHLLLPGYVSVGADGKITTKEMIVGKARSRTPEELVSLRAEIARWKASHPSKAQVAIFADTAILRWTLPRAGEPVSSADVFVYVDGQWRAAYSQHTSASK